MSRGTLTALLGVNRSTVSGWERGTIFSMSPAVLKTLTVTLGVEPDWLLTRALEPHERVEHDDAP